jgi:sulfoxide reductase heme-binding subunit YedZ
MASPPYPWLQPALLTGSLAPPVWLALQWRADALGPNPVELVLNQLGLLTLLFLLASLACTPLKVVLGWTWPLRVRRTLGLLAFGYGVAHFTTYIALDQGFDWGVLAEDIAKRPFILVGFLALLVLVPLAVTSTNRWVRRLGYPAWKRLHRLAYVAAVLGVVHFVWRVKRDVTEPLVYAGVLGVLLGVRVVDSVRRRRRHALPRQAVQGGATPRSPRA